MKIIPNLKLLVRRETENFQKADAYQHGFDCSYWSTASTMYSATQFCKTLINGFVVKWYRISCFDTWIKIKVYENKDSKDPIMIYHEQIKCSKNSIYNNKK